MGVTENKSGIVQTVTGAIPTEALGVTLTHEHVISDASPFFDPTSASGLGDAKVDITNLARLRHDPFGCKDNLRVTDQEVAIEELSRFAAAGGRTIIDATPIGLGRDVVALRRISEETGVNIVAGAGYYVNDVRPPDFAALTVDDITKVILRDLKDGVPGTSIQSGVIGEIGITNGTAEISGEEEKLLRAAARAQARAHVPLLIHLTDPLGHEVLDVVEEEGGSVSATVLCHRQTRHDRVYYAELADRGVRLGYDTFGIDWYFARMNVQSPSDDIQTRMVAEMIEAGYARHLLLSSDVFVKMQLVRFGGPGYHHVIDNIIPRLRRLGVGDDVLDMLMVANARTLFENALPERVSSL